MSLTAPTPPTGDESPDDSLKILREKLKEQRVARQASLAKHKRTTCIAVETAKSLTTFYDPKKIREALEAEEPVEDSANAE